MDIAEMMQETIINVVQEMLSSCECGDPTCPRNFEACETPEQFLNQFKHTYIFMNRQRSLMIGELAQGVTSEDSEYRDKVARKVRDQANTALQLQAGMDLIVVAILLTPRQGTAKSYTAELLNKCRELAKENMKVELARIDDPLEDKKYVVN